MLLLENNQRQADNAHQISAPHFRVLKRDSCYIKKTAQPCGEEAGQGS